MGVGGLDETTEERIFRFLGDGFPSEQYKSDIKKINKKVRYWVRLQSSIGGRRATRQAERADKLI